MNRRVEVTVSPLFFCLFAVLLIYEPQGIAAGCLAASLLHESGHLAVMAMRRALPHRIAVGVFGMRIEKGEGMHLSFLDEFLIAAGGPAVNGLCCALFLCLDGQKTAVIHLLVGALNVLPIYPLDGGTMLQCILLHFFSKERTDTILRAVSLLVVFPLGVAGFYLLMVSGYNASLLLVDAYLVLLLLFKR